MSRAAGLALLLSCILLSSCSTLSERASYYPHSASAVCLPGFPDKDGWYGGDGAYSIRLDDRRVLWLFGDTFVSDQEGRQDRVDMKVVLGTTLAISTCGADGQFHIRYFLKRSNGDFVSSFGEKEWLWPQDPFMVDHTLYVPLVSVKADPQREGPFKFEIAGHKIARIRNFAGSDPNKWSTDYLDLTQGIPEGVKAFATTSVVYEGYVYHYPLYSATKDGVSVLGNILARIPTARLDDPARAIEYWTKDGQWEKALDHRKVKVVLDAAVSEMSVRYHPDKGKWIAVYMSIRNNGNQVLYQTADAPVGPWTGPSALIGSIPEVDPNGPRYDKDNFCYAGKEHLEFARGRNLVVTYVCNSYADFEDNTSFIRKNLYLYRPIVKKIQV
ncbi:MAG: DUF4185 domain-containing protein, partial [Proteobacteria bacterium]|nr:DUF4185 domain-containing protein [Pseudomonadota bacterium]